MIQSDGTYSRTHDLDMTIERNDRGVLDPPGATAGQGGIEVRNPVRRVDRMN
jgi:hypothetical protein